MQRLKVMTIIGTRPEIIRLSRVIPRLDASEAIEHILVHTGQNYDYELNRIFFDDLELRAPDHFLEAAAATPAATIGRVIERTDELLHREAPDALLVLGDTNSCMAVIAARKRGIPIFHMEAGNRCFDERVPEEINRRIVDHVADINLPYSAIAREYLLAEGLPADRIITTGSPMREVLEFHRDRIEASDVIERLGLEPGGYFVVSSHRAENVESDERFGGLLDILRWLGSRAPVIVSTHPRTRNRLDRDGIEEIEGVRFLKPLGFSDYVRLQRGARCVLSDSGTISEESSILGFPALNIREAHERPEAMEEAAVMMVGLELERVRQALSILPERTAPVPVADYAATNVSAKIERILIGYTSYARCGER